MKLARPLLITTSVLLAVAGLILVAVLLPPVQRWALLRAARAVPGLQLEVGRVSAGFSGATLEQVRGEKQHITFRAERIAVEFPLLGYVFGRQLHVSHLLASGLQVDASRLARTTAGATAAGAPAAAPGVLGKLQLPFDLTLDDVRLNGNALLPGSSAQAPLQAEFAVTGGGVGAGREGRLELKATLYDPTPGATVTTLRAQGDLRATLTAQRGFDKVDVALVVDAEGPALSNQSQLKLGAALYRSSGAENYEVAIDTLIRGTNESLLHLRARLPAGSPQYTGDWQLNVRTAQLEPFALGTALPEFTAKGAGQFSYDTAGGGYGLRGSLQSHVERLEAMNPAWRSFGPLQLEASFDGEQAGGVVNLNTVKATLANSGPVLDARNTAPIRYDLHKHQLLGNAAGTETLLRLNLVALPLEWLRPFTGNLDVSGGPITGAFDVGRTAGSGTAAVLHGNLQLPELTLTQAGRPLLVNAAVGVRAEATLGEDLLDASLLELTLKTPEGDAVAFHGQMKLPLQADGVLAASGTVEGSSPKLLARWLPGAAVTAKGQFALARKGDSLELQPGRLQLQQGDKSLLTVAVVQPFSADLRTHAVAASDPRQTLARIELGHLPLAWLPLTEPEAALGGFVQQGTFELLAEGTKAVVRTTSPLRLGDVSLTQNRRVALGAITLEATPSLEFAGPADFVLQTGDLTVRGAGRPLLTGKGEAKAEKGQPTQANFTFTLEIPALATQPLFADARAVSAGRAVGEVRAVSGVQQQVEARVTLNGLVASANNQILPVANLGFRGLVQRSGAVSLQVPILLDNGGRRSDLNFALELLPLGRGYSVDGKLTGQQVDLEDAQGMLAVFLASAGPEDPDKPAVRPGSTTPDAQAAWSRFSGQVLLDVKSVTRGKEWAMTGLNGTLAIEPARLSLPKLEAAFGETSRFQAKAEMRFTGGPMPYRLTGSYTLNDFDAGKLFKAFDPAKPPTIEGLFAMSSTFAGNGETPERAIERLHGDFQLTSRQGVFRGLARTGSKLSRTSKAVELGASVLGSILGSEKATRTAEKVAGQAYFVDQLAQTLGELKFDLFSVKLSRDELLNMALQDISLVSAELRLNGRGEVAYVPGKTLLEQPLTASLELAARGKTEEQLGKLRLLSGAKDDLGYARAKEPVTLAGTLGKPDPTAFFTRIASSKLADFLDSDN